MNFKMKLTQLKNYLIKIKRKLKKDLVKVKITEQCYFINGMEKI